MKNKSFKVGLRTIKTVISVFLCFFIDNYRYDSTPFYAAIASILYTQPDMKNSLRIAKSREISTIIGGMSGMLFLTLERRFTSIYPELFRELVLSLMLIPLIYLSLLLKQKNGTALICVVFLCVTITHERDTNPLYFAWSRIVNISLGIVISLIVNSITFHQLQEKVWTDSHKTLILYMLCCVTCRNRYVKQKSQKINLWFSFTFRL